MSSESSVLAHHFDDLEQQHEAATLGMWAFLVTELLFFGGLFTGYTVYRWRTPLAFEEASRHLDLWLGTINTGVLLVSSLTMALAVHAAQLSRHRAATMYLLLTVLLGAGFLIIKMVEYGHKFTQGIYPGSIENIHVPPELAAQGVQPNNVALFYSFYFTTTGLHALHMLIGMGLLLSLAVRTARGRLMGEAATRVEITGLYWHFVDIVWIFVFPLYYLIGLT